MRSGFRYNLACWINVANHLWHGPDSENRKFPLTDTPGMFTESIDDEGIIILGRIPTLSLSGGLLFYHLSGATQGDNEVFKLATTSIGLLLASFSFFDKLVHLFSQSIPNTT